MCEKKEKKEGGVVCRVCVLVNDYVRFVLTNLRKKKTQVIEVKKYLGVIFKRYHSRFFPCIGSHISKFFWNNVQHVVIAQIRMKLICGTHGLPWFP